MKFFKIIIFLTISFLYIKLASASECILNGAKFTNLNSNQVNALKKSGGNCIVKKVGSSSGMNWGNAGYVNFQGKKMDYIDFAAEDPYSMAGKPVTLYGYYYSYFEQNRNKVWGYRFDLNLYPGEDGMRYLKTSGSTKIDVIIAPWKSKKYPDTYNTLNRLRKENFKVLEKSKSGNGLVKVTGKAGAYSNSGALYVRADKIEVLGFKK